MKIKNYYYFLKISHHEQANCFDPVFFNGTRCNMCNSKWKPNRTSHCSGCGSCILKMDHHCPWIINCVGVRNHRAFMLFTVYMSVIKYMKFLINLIFLDGWNVILL